MEHDIKKEIRKYALLNALKHEGKPTFKAVLGKVLSQKPDLRYQIKELIPKINVIINEVNQLSLDEIKREVNSNWPELLYVKKEKVEKILPPLPNINKYQIVRTRFSPNPDCVLHFGSLRALILSYQYSRKYKGKFILRFEDTDPRLKKSTLEFYDSIREDLRWLGCRWDEEYIQSDRLDIYYQYAEKLLELNGGYICSCLKNSFKENVSRKLPCPCRKLSLKVQLQRWQKMLKGEYTEGTAVFRVKTNLSHPNPAVRDWPAFRIIDTQKHPHPKVGSKYHVWPLYNFACGIDDHLLNITHIIRGKEHMTNTTRQKYLFKHLGWDYPEAIHYGRLKIIGADLSKSKILQAVENGIVSGFDDPRLATIVALRRRGFVPECFKIVIMEIGTKPVEATISWENIFAINRKILDPSSNRYFYVEDPIRIIINGIHSEIDVKILLHPDYPSKGEKHIILKPINGKLNLFISKRDAKNLQLNKIIRLMELFNIQITDLKLGLIQADYHSKDVKEAIKLNAQLIQWVPSINNIHTEIIMPDFSSSSGLAEASLLTENTDSSVQLVRFGFARIDEKHTDKVVMYLTHP